MDERLVFIQPSFNLFNLLINKLLRDKREIGVGAMRHESLLDNETNTWTYQVCSGMFFVPRVKIATSEFFKPLKAL